MKTKLRNLINEKCPELSRTRKTSWGDEHTEYLTPSWGDYLMCLGEDYAIDGTGYILYDDGVGAFYTITLDTDVGERNIRVDLSKSPLEQTDEVTEKMVDLIPPL